MAETPAALSFEGLPPETFGEALKTAPRGYPRDHARVHLLRDKSLVARRRLASAAKGITRATPPSTTPAHLGRLRSAQRPRLTVIAVTSAVGCAHGRYVRRRRTSTACHRACVQRTFQD